jgi:hypothetical protein
MSSSAEDTVDHHPHQMRPATVYSHRLNFKVSDQHVRRFGGRYFGTNFVDGWDVISNRVEVATARRMRGRFAGDGALRRSLPTKKGKTLA